MTTEQQNQPDWLPYLHFGYLPPQEPVLPFEPPGNLVTLPADLNRAATQAGDVLSRAGKAFYNPESVMAFPAGATQAGLTRVTWAPVGSSCGRHGRAA